MLIIVHAYIASYRSITNTPIIVTAHQHYYEVEQLYVMHLLYHKQFTHANSVSAHSLHAGQVEPARTQDAAIYETEHDIMP